MAAALVHSVQRAELRVEYQPIVELRAGTVVAFEALARWASPLLGAVSPSRFIPVAEETGQIEAIGAWVLATACEEIAHASGPWSPAASVNVSGWQLGRHSLEATVAEALAASGLAPERLWLEVTETAPVGESSAATRSLERLHAIGVRVLIDDFGTGYSSLAHLRDYPAQGLKIDRRFVAGLGWSFADTTIVRATIELAHALGLQAMAEGVETEEQEESLRALGCDLAQGYLWSRSVAPARIGELLGNGGRVPSAGARGDR